MRVWWVWCAKSCVQIISINTWFFLLNQILSLCRIKMMPFTGLHSTPIRRLYSQHQNYWHPLNDYLKRKCPILSTRGRCGYEFSLQLNGRHMWVGASKLDSGVASAWLVCTHPGPLHITLDTSGLKTSITHKSLICVWLNYKVHLAWVSKNRFNNLRNA